MIKTLAAAAVLSLGLAGYAVAQEPAAAPAAPMAAPMHHHHHHYHHTITIIITTTCTTRLRWLRRLRPPRNNLELRRDLFDFKFALKALRTKYCSESFFVFR